MAIKSGALSRAFFEEPPYYEHEVLANLEEFNLKADANLQSNNNNFAKVLSGLDKSADSIVSTISDESERSRIEAQINAEKIEAGISETNYNLLDISFGISNLEDSMRDSAQELRLQVRESSEDIVKQIHQSGEDVVDQLEITNNRLSSIDNNLLAINDSLKGIGSILSIILERINKPNEVQAIELADQIRISLAIGKHDEALRVTRKAMELCSTSITVTAYHLMTLSLFNDEELIKESEEVYKDFVNLINFKLFDSGSDTQSVRDEIYYVAYPALFALSRTLGGRILNETQRLYSSISGDKIATDMLLTKPLKDKSTEVMTLHPSPLRELHWTVILKEEIIANKAFDKLANYIPRVARNNILIKNELLIIANKELYESKVLRTLLYKTWHEDSATDEELECINIFISMQPQHNINIDEKTLLLIDRYVSKYELPINNKLISMLLKINSKFNENVINKYNKNVSRFCDFLKNKEEDILVKLKKYSENLLSTENAFDKKNKNSISEINIKNSQYEDAINDHNKTIADYKNKLKKLNTSHFYDDPDLGLKITMVLLGIPMAIMVVASFSEGVWYGILTLIGMLLLGYVIFGIGVVAAIFAEGIVHILRLLFGVDKTAVANKKQNIESKIRSESQKIYTIEENIESVSELNDVNNKKSLNIRNEHYINFLNDARNEVKSIVPQIGLLKETYDDVVYNFFFSTSPIEKTNNEMEELIEGYFPNKASLSKNFHQKFKKTSLNYEDGHSKANNIEEKLLFNKSLTLEDIPMLKSA